MLIISICFPYDCINPVVRSGVKPRTYLTETSAHEHNVILSFSVCCGLQVHISALLCAAAHLFRPVICRVNKEEWFPLEEMSQREIDEWSHMKRGWRGGLAYLTMKE